MRGRAGFCVSSGASSVLFFRVWTGLGSLLLLCVTVGWRLPFVVSCVIGGGGAGETTHHGVTADCCAYVHCWHWSCLSGPAVAS